MNTKDIEYFLMVYQCGSITKAAEALYIAQPALSRYISNLESQLNVTLFNRKKSPLELTPAGVRFLKYAQTIELLDRQLKEDFGVINQTLGHVSLGVPPLLGDYILPKILPPFRMKLSGVKVDLTIENTKGLQRKLLSGELDLAILSSPLQSSEVVTTLLVNDPFYLITNLSHPVTINSDGKLGTMENPLPISIQQFQSDVFIMLAPEKSFHKTVTDLFNFYGFKPFDTISVPSMNIAADLVREGIGVSFALRCMLSRYPFGLYFCTLSERDYLPVTASYSKKAAAQNPCIKMVLDFICNTLNDVGGVL